MEVPTKGSTASGGGDQPSLPPSSTRSSLRSGGAGANGSSVKAALITTRSGQSSPFSFAVIAKAGAGPASTDCGGPKEPSPLPASSCNTPWPGARMSSWGSPITSARVTDCGMAKKKGLSGAAIGSNGGEARTNSVLSL
jgi:hypothetical protein